MSGHTIAFTLNRGGGLTSNPVVCDEPPEANCHLTASCDCEEYERILTDADGKYHTVDTFHGDEIKHRMTSNPEHCNIREWLENTDCLDELGTEDVTLTIPIEPVWVGSGYDWKPVTA